MLPLFSYSKGLEEKCLLISVAPVNNSPDIWTRFRTIVKREFSGRSTMQKVIINNFILERFSYDLEMKTREQNRNNKRTEIGRFDWFFERIQTRVSFVWLSKRSRKN